MTDSAASTLDWDALDAWIQRLRDVHLLDESSAVELRSTIEKCLVGGLNEPRTPLLTILLLGATQVGKSQLLNALAGERLAETGDNPPTTRQPLIYAHEDTPIDHLFQYGTTLGEMATLPKYYRKHRREELRDKVLIDSPDIDSHCLDHREQVMKLLPAVDVVLYVVSPQKYLDKLGWQILVRERGRRAFAFVLNKWDARSPAPTGSPDIDTDFIELLREGGYKDPLLFRVSSLYWVEKREHGGRAASSPPPGDQFLELEGWLASGLSSSVVEVIQQRRRRALWGELASKLSPAVPGSVANHPWQADARTTLTAIRTQGWNTLRPKIAARSQGMAKTLGIVRWPSSPGLFGWYLRAVEALSTLVAGWNGMTLPPLVPRIDQMLPRLSPTNPTADTLPTPFPTSDPTQGVALVEGRIKDLELRARQARLPLEWIGAHWRETADRLPGQMAAAVDRAAAEMIERPFPPGRYALGLVTLAIIELLIVTMVMMSAWRLGTAFVSGTYLGAIFISNALALLACIVAGGHVAMSCCFPPPEGRFRRTLEVYLRETWEAAITEMETAVSTYFAEAGALRTEGEQFSQALNQEIERCNVEPHDGKDTTGGAEYLFG